MCVFPSKNWFYFTNFTSLEVYRLNYQLLKFWWRANQICPCCHCSIAFRVVFVLPKKKRPSHGITTPRVLNSSQWVVLTAGVCSWNINDVYKYLTDVFVGFKKQFLRFKSQKNFGEQPNMFELRLKLVFVKYIFITIISCRDILTSRHAKTTLKTLEKIVQYRKSCDLHDTSTSCGLNSIALVAPVSSCSGKYDELKLWVTWTNYE